jgi:hypothetical protein
MGPKYEIFEEASGMNSEITDYEIISDHDVNKLKMKVKALIGQEWRLYGDLQIVVTASGMADAPLYTQVMVKAKL